MSRVINKLKSIAASKNNPDENNTMISIRRFEKHFSVFLSTFLKYLSNVKLSLKLQKNL